MNGKFENEGYFFSSDGTFYKGSWKDSKRNGKGEQKYLDGSRYTGEWCDDKKHGKGIVDFPDGNSFIAFFKYDVMIGKGDVSFDFSLLDTNKNNNLDNFNNNININNLNNLVNNNNNNLINNLNNQNQQNNNNQNIQNQQNNNFQSPIVPNNIFEDVHLAFGDVEKVEKIEEKPEALNQLLPNVTQLDKNHLKITEKKVKNK